MSFSNQYSTQVAQLLERLSQYDEATLSAKPASGGWSVKQVCYHLLMAERGFVVQFEKRQDKLAETKPMTLKTRWNYLILRGAISLPFLKFKAPDVVANVPDDLPAFAEMKNNWLQNNQNFLAKINSLPTEHAEKAIFRHPFVGFLDAKTVVHFCQLHTARHIQQIDRILKEIR